MQFTKTHKAAAVIGAGAIAVSGAGIAFAAWTSSGSGSGTASSTTSQNSVISASTHASDLYPGADKTVLVSITNPNDYPVVVNSISVGTSDQVGTGTVTQSTNCAAGTVTSAVRTAADSSGLAQSDGTSKTIAAKGSATYQLATHMAGTATDGCKSVDFNLPLTASLSSNAS